MAMLPFQVTISEPDPTTGGNVMWNVQGATIDQFVQALRDLQVHVPSLAGRVTVLSTAALRSELSTSGPPRVRRQPPAEQQEPPRNITTAPSAPAGPDPMPTCPISHTSRASRFYSGLYCSATHDGKKCNWKHECQASCTHPSAAA